MVRLSRAAAGSPGASGCRASTHAPKTSRNTWSTPERRGCAGLRRGLRERTRTALTRGCTLYADGRYFEAHEAWEGAWLEESGEIRALLHALILTAAGLVKAWRDGRPAGTVKHLESAAEKLARLPRRMAGLNLARFRGELGEALEAARRWRDGAAAGLETPPPTLLLSRTRAR